MQPRSTSPSVPAVPQSLRPTSAVTRHAACLSNTQRSARSYNRKMTGADKDVEKREPLCAVGGKVTWHSQQLLNKGKMETPPRPGSLTSGYRPRSTESRSSKRYWYTHVHGIILKAKTWKEPVSLDRRRIGNVIYTQSRA